MRRARFSTLIAMGSLLVLAVLAQGSYRLERLADSLVEMTGGISDGAYAGFRARYEGNRADVEVLYLVQQFHAGAQLFRRMVYDDRPDSELREAAALLAGQARQSERFGYARREWQQVRRTLDDLQRELGGVRSEPRDAPPPKTVIGRVRWRGTVDDVVHISVQGDQATTQIVSGGPVRGDRYEFTSALPRRRLTLEIEKRKGRGSIDIIQQPAPENGFTAVIRIRDNKGGNSEYDFELIW